MFLAIAVDNLANAQELTAAEEEAKELEEQVTMKALHNIVTAYRFSLVQKSLVRLEDATPTPIRQHHIFIFLCMDLYLNVQFYNTFVIDILALILASNGWAMP